MTETAVPSKASTIVHWVAVVFLFLMVAQPTFDNTRALMTGALVMGDVQIDVTAGKMALHIIAMIVGWVGLGLFFQRKKLGAYLSIVSHVLGLTAVATQTPELFDAMPMAAVGVFFVILLVVTLGPILAFKDQYA
jgi:hypothetical protein